MFPLLKIYSPNERNQAAFGRVAARGASPRCHGGVGRGCWSGLWWGPMSARAGGTLGMSLGTWVPVRGWHLGLNGARWSMPLGSGCDGQAMCVGRGECRAESVLSCLVTSFLHRLLLLPVCLVRMVQLCRSPQCSFLLSWKSNKNPQLWQLWSSVWVNF